MLLAPLAASPAPTEDEGAAAEAEAEAEEEQVGSLLFARLWESQRFMSHATDDGNDGNDAQRGDRQQQQQQRVCGGGTSLERAEREGGGRPSRQHERVYLRATRRKAFPVDGDPRQQFAMRKCYPRFAMRRTFMSGDTD